MNTAQSDIELIERFISGSLNHDELVDFETRLEADHEFARKFRLRKAFPSLFNAPGEDLIVQEIKESPTVEVPKIRAREEKPRRFKPGYIIWPALSLFIAILVLWFFFIRSKPAVNETAERITTPAKTTVPAKSAIPARTQVQPLIQSAARVNTSSQPPAGTRPDDQAVKSQTLVTASDQASTNQTTAPAKPRPEPPKPVITGHNAVELLSPEDNKVVTRGEDLVFKWKMATDSFTNFYILSEATNKLAWWRGIKPGIRELTVPAIKFKPGKFYWYVGRREYKRTLIIME